MIDPPFVSVIIVNFNGKHFLSSCLKALQQQTYPPDSFEVIISDNASSDGSAEYVRGEYPWVRLLENAANLGFASGNNVAIRSSQGDYLVLLNNDTLPERSWLENLVRSAEENPQAGIITGRLYLYYDQITIELQSETFQPVGDGRTLGVQLYAVNTDLPYGVVQYLDGFYGYEPGAFGGSFRWTNSRALLGVPIPAGRKKLKFSLELGAYRPENQPVALQMIVRHAGLNALTPLFSGLITGGEPQRIDLDIPGSHRRDARPVLQNAGSIVFRDGASRDRGTYVRDAEVLFEVDTGQYDHVEEVFSGCGANLLLRRRMLDEIGFFDDDFFMYYEDTDLSWRARLAGWKVLYAPEAVVRHIHCGTTQEWSPFFLFLVERNRLAMVVKNGELRQIIRTLARYLGRTVINLMTAVRALLFRRPGWQTATRWPRHHMRVIKALMLWMPSLIHKRMHIQKTRQVFPASLRDWFVG